MSDRNLILGGRGSLDTGIRLGSWMGQLLLASFLPLLVWGLLVEPALGWNEITGRPFGKVGTQIANAMGIALLGFALGMGVRLLFPVARQIGCKIWIVPLGLLLLAIVCDLFTFHFDWKSILTDYLFWSQPGGEEIPLLRDLLTYPTMSCLSYSLAIASLRRQ